MNVLRRMFLLLVLLLQQQSQVETAQIPTHCDTQLRNFYLQQGLNASYATLQPLVFSTGTAFGVSFVTVSVAFDQAATLYQAARLNLAGPSQLNQSNRPYSSYFTLDIPWCVTDMDITCTEQITNGLVKTNCSTLIDYDLGGNSPLAGRLYVYPDRVCSGGSAVVNITFYNVALQASVFNATYTYDAYGLLNYELLNRSAAQYRYQTSSCLFSDGDPADAQDQGQFVCLGPVMVCNQTRLNGRASLQIIPLPQYSCVGSINPPNNASAVQGMLWRIVSLEPVNTISGAFYLTFCASSNQACAFQNSLTSTQLSFGGLTQYLLYAGTRRQFFNPSTDFGQQLNLFYQGRVTAFAPIYPLSPLDPIISTLPCFCGFSMDCINGRGDTTSVISAYIYENNVLPTPVPGPALVIPFGQANLTIDASLSYDDDNAPGPLITLWKLYQKPVGSLPITELPPLGTTQQQITFNTSQWSIGLYVFLLYASDSQDITFTVLNVTVVRNLVYAVVFGNPTEQFVPYYGISPTNEATCVPGPPEECIILNGSLSHATNPLLPFFYNWTQIAGAPTPVPYICDLTGVQATAGLLNATKSVACFIPPLIGLYEYRLCVSDGLGAVDCVNIQIWVVPFFLTPRGPPLVLPNFTAPPPRNLTPPTRPIFQFPNFSAPFASLPPANPSGLIDTNVSVLFPVYPPLTTSEKLMLIAISIAVIFLILFFMSLFIVVSPRYTNQRYERVLYPDR